MEIAAESRDVRRFVALRANLGRAPAVLTPTMGALHAGHADLIRRGAEIARARGLAGGCIVTIFVNPTQFNDAADFARYPRTLEADLALCAEAGASAVLAPGAEDVYPPGVAVPAPALPPAATAGLEDAARPGHFAGVCQVVARLFEMVHPVAAVFGEKDWQQLRVVDEMIRRDGLGVEIIGAPTVRESDGLALSSRNVFLSPAERARALALIRALAAAGGASSPAEAEALMNGVLRGAGVAPDYASVRDAASLRAPRPGRPMRALVAGRVGPVRLIDNAPWPDPGPEVRTKAGRSGG